jgi:phosphonatase-like hydrolase
MHFELVVFDMAGTTVVDDDKVNECLRAALRAGGVSVTRSEANAVMGLPKPRAIRALLERAETAAAWSDEEVGRMHASFVERMIEHYATSPEVREVPGMSQTFARLREMGIKVALDTGFDRAIASAIVRRLGWSEMGLIDAWVASDEVRRGRPHPDLVFEAMRRTGLSLASRVMKVGDTPSDVQEGKAAGCPVVVAVTNGSHTEAELRPHGPTFILPTAALVPELIRRIGAQATRQRSPGYWA